MNKSGDSFVSEDTKQTIMVKINGIIEKLDNLRILNNPNTKWVLRFYD